MVPGMLGGVALRTRFIDDYLLKRLEKGVRQVVILGAGYDARAYRFEEIRHNVRVFEVDHPATQQTKKEKLKQILGTLPDHVTYVAVRFNSEDLADKMAQNGYRQDCQTLFIWEGVTMYLSAEAVDATLAFITKHSPTGSSVIFDYFPPCVVDGRCSDREGRSMQKMAARYGEAFRFGIQPQAVEAFLSRRGFNRIRNISAFECKQIYLEKIQTDLPVSKLFYLVHAEVCG